MDTPRPDDIERLRERRKEEPESDFVRIRLAAFENGKCDHSEYTFKKFGRVCPCGEWLSDFGD